MDRNESIIMLIFYLLVLTGIGIYFFKPSFRPVSFLLGDRDSSAIVTGFSAVFTEFSNWILLFQIGFFLYFGVSAMWIAVGAWLMYVVLWYWIAPYFRSYTGKLNVMTLPGFLGARFGDPWNFMRYFSSAIMIVIFFTFSTGGVIASALLVELCFGIPYPWASAIAFGVVLLYTELGGYRAICWASLFQGLLTLVIVGLLSIILLSMISPEDLVASCEWKAISLSPLPPPRLLGDAAGWARTGHLLALLLGGVAFGVGFFGQTHVLLRFFVIRSLRRIPRARQSAILLFACLLLSSAVIGLFSIPLFDSLGHSRRSPELLLFLLQRHFSPFLGGLLLAALFAAVFPVIDSQLLNLSGLASEIFCPAATLNQETDRRQMHIIRWTLAGVSLVGWGISLLPPSFVLQQMPWLWGLSGAVFGPAVVAALHIRKASALAVNWGMIVGLATTWIMRLVLPESTLWSAVPGSIANLATIWGLSAIFPQRNETILAQYDMVHHDVALVLKKHKKKTLWHRFSSSATRLN